MNYINVCRLTLFLFLDLSYKGALIAIDNIVHNYIYGLIFFSFCVFCSSIIFHNITPQHKNYKTIRRIDIFISLISITYHLFVYFTLKMYQYNLFILVLYKIALIFYVLGNLTNNLTLGFLLHSIVHIMPYIGVLQTYDILKKLN